MNWFDGRGYCSRDVSPTVKNTKHKYVPPPKEHPPNPFFHGFPVLRSHMSNLFIDNKRMPSVKKSGSKYTKNPTMINVKVMHDQFHSHPRHNPGYNLHERCIKQAVKSNPEMMSTDSVKSSHRFEILMTTHPVYSQSQPQAAPKYWHMSQSSDYV